MPITRDMFNAQQAGVNQIINQGGENQRSAQEALLKQYLQGREPAIAGQKQEAVNTANSIAGDKNIQKLKDLMTSGALPDGSGASLGENGNVAITRGFNPMAVQQQTAHQAQGFVKTAQGAYKPINDQLDAAQSTIDALNQGNSNSDKLALINEARIAAGQGGSRAISHMVDLLSGGQTAAGTFQDRLNWLQNTPNIPTLQPAQRDAIRESVFGRLPQLAQQHQSISQQLMQQGPIIAPGADTSTLLNSFSSPIKEKLDRMTKSQQEYQSQRQKMQPQPAISQPATANANPTTLDRLKALFGGGPTAATQTMRVKHKASGQTGTIPANEFDPNQYEQVQ